jgi:hypothetical protein
MSRRLLLFPLLLLACLALPLSGQAANHFKTGVSDQVPNSFKSPLFQPLGFSAARYITPYDVMDLPAGSPDRVALGQWIANSAGQDLLVSFEHSHTRGRERHVPSVAEYTKAIKLFLRAYPKVKSISPWNEADRCQRKVGSGANAFYVGQPICHNPKRAADYYKATRTACRVLHRRCTIVALDILDQNNVKAAVSYVKKFQRYAKPFPTVWGIHNYSDTNRFSTKRTKALLKATRRGQVWLTETGGIVKFGKSFPFSPTRAARALRCMFTIAKSNSRIKRLYIYNFSAAQPESDFDAGLINPDGSKRPGWNVVKKRQSGRCHK